MRRRSPTLHSFEVGRVKEQLAFFGTQRPQIINVASVPQRSPFRYPGGKTWLIPYVRQWLSFCEAKSKKLIEPFAGGGIVSLTAVAEKRVNSALMVELDEDVAAVWQTILSNDGEWLADKIFGFSVDSNTVQETLEKKYKSQKDIAFSTLLRNRVSHGGILAHGAGLLKNGENGKGLRSRWYPETLKNRILSIQTYKDNIKFIRADGFDVIEKYRNDKNVVFFIDPPYTVAGKRLYRYSEIDHEKLFALTATVKANCLITYDNSDEIIALARKYKFQIATIPMKGTQHTEKTELLISQNLDWVKYL